MHRPRGAIVVAGLVLAVLALGCLSYFVVVDLPFWVTRSDWITLHVYDGRFRVFWIRSYGDPIDVASYHEPVQIRLRPRAEGVERAPSRGGYPVPPLRNTDIPVRIGAAWEVDDFGFNHSRQFRLRGGGNHAARIAFVRLPIWLIAGVLLLIPLRAAIFGPVLFRRRRRRNHCGYCGYDLTGLPEPRCPECGNQT